ncbi:MAG: hypothetical protein IMZ55_19120, partial [Acidobacteria bacterium]|nr:hypothetical protein [Acidobacteriota bacterium]
AIGWSGDANPSPAARLTEQYETLRACVLARNGPSGLRLGQGVVAARGMAAWMHVAGELTPDVRPTSSSGPPISVSPLMQRELIQLLGGAVLTLVDRGVL